MHKTTALALTLALALPGIAAASGSSAMGVPRVQQPTATPEQEAVEYYNDGISYRDKADKYEAEAAAPDVDAAKKAKLLEKSKSQHESSIKKYLKAVAKNPQDAEARLALARFRLGQRNLAAATNRFHVPTARRVVANCGRPQSRQRRWRS